MILHQELGQNDYFALELQLLRAVGKGIPGAP